MLQRKRGIMSLLCICALWLASITFGISTASSTYSVFGEVFVHALGVESMDIKVIGSDEDQWTPDQEADSAWVQATDEPLIVEIDEPKRLLTKGVTLWSFVAVRNVSPKVGVKLRVTIRDGYDESWDSVLERSGRGSLEDIDLNLFNMSHFTLVCNEKTIITDAQGTDVDLLSRVDMPRVLPAGEYSLCTVGVRLNDAAFEPGFVMIRESRVVPQIFFEGEQQ
ncbi:hypothetical protein [Bifidobacterium aquikefiri]|uniref:hypothetical protein n=1 Tax=Bifidobacterium aquikefiri TaxID=1653207 RepID=UPI0039E775EE